MYDSEMVNDLPQISTQPQTCPSCATCKIHRKPFLTSTFFRAAKALKLVHSDIYGPVNTESLGENLYFVHFIDDKTRMTWVYFSKTKSEVFHVFKKFKSMVEVQSVFKIKCLKTNNIDEYTSPKFEMFLQSNEIDHHLIVPYSPQQNEAS